MGDSDEMINKLVNNSLRGEQEKQNLVAQIQVYEKNIASMKETIEILKKKEQTIEKETNETVGDIHILKEIERTLESDLANERLD